MMEIVGSCLRHLTNRVDWLHNRMGAQNQNAILLVRYEVPTMNYPNRVFYTLKHIIIFVGLFSCPHVLYLCSARACGEYNTRFPLFCSIPLERKQTLVFFQKFDVDKSNTLTYEEFVKYVYGE